MNHRTIKDVCMKKKLFSLVFLLVGSLGATHHQVLARYGCKRISSFVCNQGKPYEHISLYTRNGKRMEQYMIFLVLRDVLDNPSLQDSYDTSLSSYLDGRVWRSDIDMCENFILVSRDTYPGLFEAIYSESKNRIENIWQQLKKSSDR